jgi:hypothetical protein
MRVDVIAKLDIGSHVRMKIPEGGRHGQGM